MPLLERDLLFDYKDSLPKIIDSLIDELSKLSLDSQYTFEELNIVRKNIAHKTLVKFFMELIEQIKSGLSVTFGINNKKLDERLRNKVIMKAPFVKIRGKNEFIIT